MTYDPVETDDLLDLRSLWRIVHRRRWTILGILLGVFFLALIWTLVQKPVYRAEALLEIEAEVPTIPYQTRGAEDRTVSPIYLQTQCQIMTSRSFLQSVTEKLGLAGLPGRLSVTPLESTRLIRVRHEAPDPELTARVVNTVATTYIEHEIDGRWQSSQRASQWLSDRLMEAKARLEGSEQALQGFVLKNGLEFLDVEGNSENIVNWRLHQLQNELAQAEAERYQKESFYELVQTGEYASLPRLYQDPVLEGLLMVQLAGLQREATRLEAIVPPEDSRRKQVEEQIKETETLLAREHERVAERVATDYRAVVNREKLVREAFEAQQERAQQVAAKLGQLNILRREVEINKAQYVALLESLKRSTVSAEWKGSTVRIVDDAHVPLTPIKPTPLRDLPLALVLGLVLGLGAAFLQEHMETSAESESLQGSGHAAMGPVESAVRPESSSEPVLSDRISGRH